MTSNAGETSKTRDPGCPVYLEGDDGRWHLYFVEENGKRIRVEDCRCGAYYHPYCSVPTHRRKSLKQPTPPAEFFAGWKQGGPDLVWSTEHERKKMSHVIKIDRSGIRSKETLEKVCRRLHLLAPQKVDNARLFGDDYVAGEKGQVSGWAVKLPGWLKPVVFNTDTGIVYFDNYGGSWGDIQALDNFRREYAKQTDHDLAEQAMRVLQEQHLSPAMTQLEDGTIEIKVYH